MPIGVYIDNNVRDFLFQRQLDLAAELPRDEFCFCMTREEEFEIPVIPPEKPALRDFIEASIERAVVKTDSFFGFYVDAHAPDEQRMGGSNVGRWATQEELAFLEQQRTSLGSKRPTKLYKNEADRSIAACAFHSVVLTLDRKTGPINQAYKQGGRVVFLTEFDRSGKTLAEFIKAECR
jgi:hypothetical protein